MLITDEICEVLKCGREGLFSNVSEKNAAKIIKRIDLYLRFR